MIPDFVVEFMRQFKQDYRLVNIGDRQRVIKILEACNDKKVDSEFRVDKKIIKWLKENHKTYNNIWNQL